jgi:hypothetical protein
MEMEALGGFGLGVEVVAAGSMAIGGGGLLIHMTSPCPSSLQPHPSVGHECGSRSEPGHSSSCGTGPPVAYIGCVGARSMMALLY